MAKFHIAFDDGDVSLGAYFEQSKVRLVDFIVDHDVQHQIAEIGGASCTHGFFDPYLKALAPGAFLFIAYSHGNYSSLTAASGAYIGYPGNVNYFTNSFFYSMACNTGKTMGPALIARGCLAFIGYSSTAYAARDKNMDLFIQCDNYGLEQFMQGSSVKESFNSMKSYFRENIKQLVREKNILMAGYLRSNLACLVYYAPDPNLMFSAF
ncbi:MAG: hypothetical protein EOP48_03655 [Sphingobacteriales bacterium]|nr:MAG: hypothetical protein EOP48_03655 [Sphingobacteriales bacterium]